MLAIFVSAFIVSVPFAIPATKASEFYTMSGRKIIDWSSAESAANNGPVVVFLESVKVNPIDKPTNYNKQTMIKISNEFDHVSQKINKSRERANFDGQTVIFILSESLTNPQYVKGISPTSDVLPNINQIKKESAVSGTMISSGFGGGTANIEYMSLSGVPLTIFDSSVTTPYVQLATSLNQPSILREFDKSVTIHPYKGTFYNRRNAYKALGMKKFLTTDNGDINHKSRLGNSSNIDDKSAYADLEENVSAGADQSKFVQLITMQNHAPYLNNEYANLHDQIQVKENIGNNQGAVETYLTGAHETDKQTKLLLDKLNGNSRPITVVFYGDHWPSAYSFLGQRNPVLTHSTDFFIWQNDSAKLVNGTGRITKKVMAPSEFYATVKAISGVKVTPYEALQSEFSEKLPAVQSYTRDSNGRMVFVSEDGKSVDERSLTKEQKKLLDKFRLVVYDSFVGNHYLDKLEFF